MRDARASWDTIYLALASAVTTRPARLARDTAYVDTSAATGDAIVSHMHCWADCLRLEELEGIEHAV